MYLNPRPYPEPNPEKPIPEPEKARTKMPQAQAQQSNDQTTVNNPPHAESLVRIANTTAINMAVAQMRLANYFTPFGFEPERIDFDRAGQLVKDHKAHLTSVFRQTSQNLIDKIAQIELEMRDHDNTLAALKHAGVEATISADDAYQEARNYVIRPNIRPV